MNKLELRKHAGKNGSNRSCYKINERILSADVVLVLVLWVLTRFLWCSGEGSFNSAAVRVVPATNATFVLNFDRANLSVAANFLETEKTSRLMSWDTFWSWKCKICNMVWWEANLSDVFTKASLAIGLSALTGHKLVSADCFCWRASSHSSCHLVRHSTTSSESPPHLCHGGGVFGLFCLSVCLLGSRISQKLADRFESNLVKGLIVGQ